MQRKKCQSPLAAQLWAGLICTCCLQQSGCCAVLAGRGELFSVKLIPFCPDAKQIHTWIQAACGTHAECASSPQFAGECLQIPDYSAEYIWAQAHLSERHPVMGSEQEDKGYITVSVLCFFPLKLFIQLEACDSHPKKRGSYSSLKQLCVLTLSGWFLSLIYLPLIEGYSEHKSTTVFTKIAVQGTDQRTIQMRHVPRIVSFKGKTIRKSLIANST